MENGSWTNLIRWAHIAWIGFVLAGFFWTWAAFLFHQRFFNYFWLRTVHLTGVVLVTLLPLVGLYCPLTYLEFSMRFDLDNSPASGFILYYLQKLMGDTAHLAFFIRTATWIIFFTTLAAYLFRPPERAERWFRLAFARFRARPLMTNRNKKRTIGKLSIFKADR